ncbi:MAG: hypothetical protein ACFFF4_10785 [Candidatus Thorarchaeota archaeon]
MPHSGMNLKGESVSIIIMLLFFMASIYGPMGAAIPYNSEDVIDSESVSSDTVTEAMTRDPGTYVDWFVDQDSSEESWSQTRSTWRYGPSLSFDIYHENGSRLLENHYAQIDEKLNFSVTVPKTIFPKGKRMGMLMFIGQAMTYTGGGMTNSTLFMMGYAPGEANLTIILNIMSPYGETQIRYMDWGTESPPWYAFGNTFNATKFAETGGYAGTEMLDDFLTLYGAECSNTTDEHNNYFNFITGFEDQCPKLFYQVGMYVLDQDFNMISTYFYGSYYEVEGLAIGVDPAHAYKSSYGATYTLQKLDLENNILYSLNREEDFRMQFNMSEIPRYVQLGIGVPSELDATVTRTDWHWGLVEEQGGWVYDELLDTYVWNSSIQVIYEDYIYGEYEAHESVGIADEVMIEIRTVDWNETSQSHYIYTYMNDVQIEYRIIYNTTTDTFETRYGYEYWTYPLPDYVEGVYEEEIWVDLLFPDEPLYVLNQSLCSASQIGEDFVVEIVGHFTELMPTSQESSYKSFNIEIQGPNEYWFSPATYGQNPRQTSQEYEMARRITIESPVTIAKVLLENGEEVRSEVFQIDKNKKFQVLGRLQGGASSASEIDAVLFTMRAYDGRWTLDESIWSDLTYEISVDMNGIPSIRGFNLTHKENWTYGVYYDWIKVQKTGWHYEYNETSGEDEFVFGDYYDWVDIEVEGWHQEWWTYNQKLERWQREWIGARSSESEIPVTYLNVTDFSWWIEEGDLYAQFLVYVNYTAPDAECYWDFAFASDAWYLDDASEYGEHEVTSWGKEWIYSFEDPDHAGQDIYMTPVDNKLAFYNDSLCAIEGVEYFKGEERPYIVIGNEKLPIKVKEHYDPYGGVTYANILFDDYYDWENDQSYFYYELTNGTKISVTYDYKINIYNVTIANGSSFLSAQEYAYDYDYNGTLYFYWLSLDGNLYLGDWDDYHAVNVEFQDTVEPDSESNYFVIYGMNKTMELTEDWRWDSRKGTYIMIDTDNILYILNYTHGHYEAFIDGKWQQVSESFEYYTGTFLSSDVKLNTRNKRLSWYHEMGGVQYEMPYPGADAENWYDVSRMESDGGKVPVTISIVFLGNGHTVYEDMGTYYVDIGVLTFNLDMYSFDYSVANDTVVWNPLIVGATTNVGVFDNRLEFSTIERVEFESSSAYYDSLGDFYYMTLRNGTVWIVNESMDVLLVYEYDLDGKVLYSLFEYPDYYEDENTWTYYYKALNGTWYNLTEWRTLPVLATYLTESYDNGTDLVFSFQSSEYLYDWYGRYTPVRKIVNASIGFDVYISLDSDYGGGFRPIYQFMYHSTLVNASSSIQNVLKQRTTWGFDLIYGPQPIESAVYKNYEYIMIGIPSWGLWGVREFVVNPENGALDLDGDLETIDDQYYVYEVFTSTDTKKRSWDMMEVNLIWDPNGTIYGDEMNLRSWMGLNTFNWTYDWSRTYYWYHADTVELLTPSELDTVNSTILTDDGRPRPGYWEVADLVKNETYADYLAEAKREGWDWVESNTESWTWISFGMTQDYGIDYENETVTNWIDINMHYEFCGFLLWNDTRPEDHLMQVNLVNPGSAELTHYFMPDDVGEVEFLTPGPGEIGNMHVALDAKVIWGVTFLDINGTTYPYTSSGYWGWYEGIRTKNDMRTFDQKPVKVNIDEVEFKVNFQGHITDAEENPNNQVDIKIDNYVGNWNTTLLGGRKVLNNRSLALNYLADVTVAEYAFLADGTPTSGSSSLSAEYFQFETEQTRFAEMIMGGTTYDWSRDKSASYDVVSQTTPIGTFETAFESDAGISATPWNFTESMFYVTVGFDRWDGFGVYQDPVFVSYTSRRGTDAIQFGLLSVETPIPKEGIPVTIGIDIFSEVDLDSVELLYSTDGVTWIAVEMTQTSDWHWIGDCAPYPEATEVFYKVIVHTIDYGDYESTSGSYIVGPPDFTSTTTTTTTTTTTGPTPFEVPMEIVIMLVGISIAVVVLIILVIKRKQR